MRTLLRRIGGLLAPGAAVAPIQDPREVERRYRRLRPVVMVTVTVGYGFFYTCRLGLSVVKKPLIDEGIFTAAELGWIGAAFLYCYALGKLLNGFLADRVNVRVFMSVSLGLSALVNLLMGGTTWLPLVIALWAANALFQGGGGPASVVTITRWFSPKRRGTMYGIWSTAHAIGEGLTYFGVAAIASATVWRAAFWAPGVACLLVSVGIYLGLRDRPETLGLPPAYSGSPEPTTAESRPEAEPSTWQAQLLLLKRPAFWCLGLSSALMYVTRYAINDWGVLYLQEAHGFSLVQAGSLIGLNTIAGIAGCVAYGFISDRFFNARRPPVNLIFALVELVGLALIFFGPTGNTALLATGLVLYGFSLSGLLAVLGGLFAVDIAPKKAAGAAVGMIGLFSYAGAGAQEVLSGLLIQRGTSMVDGVRHYDFALPIGCWMGASVLSALLAATLWRVKTT